MVVTVSAGHESLTLVTPPSDSLHPGDAVGLKLDYDSVVFFGGDTNRRIDLKVAGRSF